MTEKDNDGGSTLMRAADGMHLGVVEYLVKQGVSLDEKDLRGQTALSWAAKAQSRIRFFPSAGREQRKKVYDYLQQAMRLSRVACQLLKCLRPINGSFGDFNEVIPLELKLLILQHIDIDIASLLSLSKCESILNYAQDKTTLGKSKAYFIREAIYKNYQFMPTLLSQKRSGEKTLLEEPPIRKKSKDHLSTRS